MITTSRYSSCGLRRDGTVACWGTGEYYLNGPIPNGADRSTPVPIPELHDVIAISAGGLHVCALQDDGDVLCWGDNHDSQLGIGTVGDGSPVPVRVRELPPATAIDGGGEHACAIVGQGRVFCWGENRDGQIGDGATTDRRLPVEVDGIADAVSISAGTNHTCAVLSDGSARCWGSNEDGQIGDGTTVGRLRAVRVDGIEDAVEISAGGYHTCARLADATVRCWGSNHQGQVGTGAPSAADPIEERALAVIGVAGAVGISAGGFHTCAVLATGRIACWGYDNAGQLGADLLFEMDDDLRDHPSPLEVVDLEGATAVSASQYAHTCALLSDGTAMCWGLNDYGELGDGGGVGETGESRVPVAVVEFDIDQPG